MLWRVLQSSQWILPKDCIVAFANTGKEEEATLRFVRDCGLHWNVPIVWLEYRNDERGFAVVDFDSASRNGEPFEAIIKKRNYLPNPVTRFCTVELKIRTMHKYLRSLGWDEWSQFVGIRADEMRRVSKIRARGKSTETVDETMCIPLADAGITLSDISEFWDRQPFNLELLTVKGRTLSGNCDLCFLKGAAQVASLIREKPDRATWWAKMESECTSEKPSGNVFRQDRPTYAQMARFAEQQTDMFVHDDEPIACFCGD
jgi:3'-phosphoadenosine 5'-phosphosulfate sulfotransferase (PAPS reductase)/FAD synthetase